MNFNTLPLSLPTDKLVLADQLLEQLAGLHQTGPFFKVMELFDPVKLPVSSRASFPADAKEAVIVDTETTGKDAETALLVELGMVKFCYNPSTMEVYGITGVMSKLEDPGVEISPEASLVNGLTNEQVAGHRIDDEEVNNFMAGTVLAIAHNASYDRVILEKRFPVFQEISWACSYKQVNWLAAWGPGASLESISHKQGFYFVAHRAVTDCFALLRVLCAEPPESSSMPNGLKQLFENARRTTFRIWAQGAHFDSSPLLKGRGYKWSPGTTPGSLKAWHLTVQDEQLNEELDWLVQSVFGGKQVLIPVERITAKSRYGSRFGVPKYMQLPVQIAS